MLLPEIQIFSSCTQATLFNLHIDRFRFILKDLMVNGSSINGLSVGDDSAPEVSSVVNDNAKREVNC